jgi:hypothetical protein
MGTNTGPLKPLRPASAAARLSIGYGDLPRLGRPWTGGDVQRLRRERPQWLTDARRAYAARKDAEAAQRRARHGTMLDEGGFTRPDDGLDDTIRDADEAYMYLTAARGVSAIDAEDAVGRRWRSWFADEPDDVGWW